MTFTSFFGFPGGSDGKESACNWESRIQSLRWKDPLQWACQSTPVFLPGELPWTEEPHRLQPTGLQRVRHDWATKHSTANHSLFFLWWFSSLSYVQFSRPHGLCSLPGSSVHRILQARILEWVAISFSREIFPIQKSNTGLLHCRQILY